MKSIKIMRDKKYTSQTNVRNRWLEKALTDSVKYMDADFFDELIEEGLNAGPSSNPCQKTDEACEMKGNVLPFPQTDDLLDRPSADRPQKTDDRHFDNLLQESFCHMDADFFDELIEEGLNAGPSSAQSLPEELNGDDRERFSWVRHGEDEYDFPEMIEAVLDDKAKVPLSQNKSKEWEDKRKAIEALLKMDLPVQPRHEEVEEAAKELREALRSLIERELSERKEKRRAHVVKFFVRDDVRDDGSLQWHLSTPLIPLPARFSGKSEHMVKVKRKWQQREEPDKGYEEGAFEKNTGNSDSRYFHVLMDAVERFPEPWSPVLLLEDHLVRAFDVPTRATWVTMRAECDGNSYLTSFYRKKAYIQTSDIRSGFICVPEKSRRRFDLAKITVDNEDIDSITVPSSIPWVYMKVSCCNNLLDISFSEFALRKNAKRINTLWIEISGCEKLKYIRFPNTSSVVKLLITNCKSLESIYFPGEVTEQNRNNIFLDRSSCPRISIVSDDDSIKEYAEEADIPIRPVVAAR